jgi:hypothetical protein
MAWFGNNLRLGCDVREKDGRHCGKYEAVVHGLHKVRWYGTGWVSYFAFKEDIVRWV